MTSVAFNVWRGRMGFTQVQAAAALGIAVNTLRVYERGERPIPIYIKLACDQILQVARRGWK